MKDEICNTTEPAIAVEPMLAPVIIKPIHAKPSLYAYYFYELKEIAKEFGYNLVLHGSLNRDLDLIAIPWINEPKDDFLMIQAFEKHLTGVYSEQKEHYMFSILPANRKSYVINLNRGGKWNNYLDEQYYIDISVTPFIGTL
jgi:hypothetical protein